MLTEQEGEKFKQYSSNAHLLPKQIKRSKELKIVFPKQNWFSSSFFMEINERTTCPSCLHFSIHSCQEMIIQKYIFGWRNQKADSGSIVREKVWSMLLGEEKLPPFKKIYISKTDC